MRLVSLFLIFTFLSGVAFAQNDWHLKRDDEGIKVYTRSTDNSDFKSIKVECTVNARPSQLVAFLLDVDKQNDWVYNNKTARLIRKVAPNEILFYAEISVPWPCTNRDYISHLTITQPSPGLVIANARAEPDVLPRQDGKVRIVNSTAHWEITSVGPAQQRIVYTVQFDPAGSVPAWLINMFVTKGPFETFQKLRVGVSKAEYRDAHLDFIKD